MRWATPHEGEKRIVRRFAWLPTRCDDSRANGNSVKVWVVEFERTIPPAGG